MLLDNAVYSRSNLYLNQHLNRLSGSSAAFFVHYWGAKPEHKGNSPHTHSFFEICYVLDGEGSYSHDGVQYPLRAGTLYCSKPGSRHYITSEGGMLLLFVALEPIEPESGEPFMNDFHQLCRYPHLFVPNAAHTPPALLWQALLAQAGDPAARYPESLEMIAYSLVMGCISLFLTLCPAGDASLNSPPTDHHSTLTQVKQYIQTHMSSKIKCQDVAKSVHLSERQLSRLLAEELGQTFPSVVKTERMKSAAYYLGFTDIPLKQIAEQTGFESIHYFTSVFNEEMGISPSQFRKNCGNANYAESMIHSYLAQIATRHQKK
ncbi:MAG: AraC family transcriptional regulator [Paenibacillus sp.]|nr:AraC family transcriptional regulator [Paenibacillus sp.]